jgi:PAS domain S-box-containing protein
MTTENLNKKIDNLKAIFGFIADPVIVIDCEGQILAANNIIGKYIAPATDLVNRNIAELKVVDEKYSTLIKNNLYKRLKGEDIDPYEIKIKGKDGTEVSLEVNAKKIQFENEELDVIVLRDTTKRLQKINRMEEKIASINHVITENKKVQDALVESEARFRHFVEAAQEGIWVIDNDFVTTFVNPYMAKMIGYQENEIIGKKLTEFLDAEWVKTITDIIRGFTSNDQKNQYEYAFPTKNGGHVHTVVTLSVISDAEKKKIGVLAVVSDITQRKHAENALKSSEELSKAIIANTPIGIATSGSNYKFTTANQAFCSILGFSESELQKLTFKDISAPETIERSVKAITALEKGEISVYSDEKRYFRKDGTIIIGKIIITPIRNAKGKLKLFVVQLEDITGRKHLEEALKQERDLLESVTASTNMVLAIINREYRITWANQTAKNAMSNLENNYCYKTFGRGASTVCEGCGVKRVFENNERVVRRDYTYNEGGKDFWWELISTPIKDKNGSVIAALEIAIDIQERKQLQNKLAEYSQRLEEIVQKRTDELKKTQAELVKSERLAAIGELAGMIGHDLRNPLTGIKNSAYYLKKKGQDLPIEQKEMLDTIDKCVDYSNRIINDLLDYSREIHLILEKQSPKKLIEESLALSNLPPNVKVNNLCELSNIMVDTDKIKRVFINLIKNAVEAMPEGGEITINSRDINGSIEISFTDTGLGINEETLPKLFAPLFTTKAQGMGFGLAICKRIIEAHKGTIVVKSVNGQGSTFTLTLPANLKMNMEVKKYG